MPVTQPEKGEPTPAAAEQESKSPQVDLFGKLYRERVFVDVPRTWLAEALGRVGEDRAALTAASDGSRRNLRRYIRQERSMPLRVLQRLLKAARAGPAELHGKIKMRIGNCGTRLSLGPTLTIDEEFVYVAELIRCDGHIPKNLWSIVFVNKEPRLISVVRRFFEKFGLRRNNMNLAVYRGVNFLRVYSRLFALILHRVFRIPLGKKGDMRVPGFVLSSPHLAAAAVRAGFDAEGNVQTRTAENKATPRRVVITNISKSYLKCLRRAMHSLSIESRIYTEKRLAGVIYRLVVYHQENLRRFALIIRPLHPKRAIKLAALLETYRKDRIPELSLRTKILRSIQRGNATRKQIASDLNLSLSRVGNQLYRLREQNLIAKPAMIWTNHGGYGVFRLTSVGERVLNRSH